MDNTAVKATATTWFTEQGPLANAADAAQKYAIIAPIGSGGMAEVFLAAARGAMGVNRLVVLKRLRANLMHEDDCYEQMFLDEARLTVRLSHPNIVHTYDVGTYNGSLFIAMEYLEGQSLKRMRDYATKREFPLPIALAVYLVTEALAGLHHAHELKNYDGTPLGIVHRDVSPHNIIVAYDGAVKLLDFGIAKATVNLSQTAHGALKGKPNYMAPEQLTSTNYDGRADVFTMGIVLFELVTQTRLFPGDAVQALNSLNSMTIPVASWLRPEIDATLDAILLKALERDPEKRYRTADAMREDLENWLSTHGVRDGKRNLSRYVSELFKDVRVQVERRIQEKMRELESATAAFHSGTDLIQNLTSSGVIQSSRIPELDSASVPLPIAPVSEPAHAPPRKHRLLLAVSIVAFALCGIFAVLLARTNFRRERFSPAVSAVKANAEPTPPTTSEALDPMAANEVTPHPTGTTAPRPNVVPQRAPRSGKARTPVNASPNVTQSPKVVTSNNAASASTALAGASTPTSAPAQPSATETAHIKIIEEPKTQLRVIE